MVAAHEGSYEGHLPGGAFADTKDVVASGEPLEKIVCGHGVSKRIPTEIGKRPPHLPIEPNQFDREYFLTRLREKVQAESRTNFCGIGPADHGVPVAEEGAGPDLSSPLRNELQLEGEPQLHRNHHVSRTQNCGPLRFLFGTPISLSRVNEVQRNTGRCNNRDVGRAYPVEIAEVYARSFKNGP